MRRGTSVNASHAKRKAAMFSLRSLLVIVAFGGLGSAALLNRTSGWASLIVTLTLSIFAYGLLRIYSDAKSRRFWIPFIIIGLSYVAVSLVGGLEVDKHLISSRMIYQLWYGNLESEARAQMMEEEALYYFLMPSGAMTWDVGLVDPTVVHDFRRVYAIAHCLIALGLAFIIGSVYWRRVRVSGT
jgi:hypothetical protein